MDTVGKITAIALAAALCALVVRQNSREIALVLSLAAGALILGQALDAVEAVRALLDELGERAGLTPAVLDPVMKTVGIGILTRLAAEVCRDAQESGIAAFVETTGAALALYVALPLMRAVLDTIAGLL